MLMESSEIDARVELLVVLCDEYDWNNQLLWVGPRLKEDDKEPGIVSSSLWRLSDHGSNKEGTKALCILQLPRL